MKIAILDDYQGVALQMADWTALTARADITAEGQSEPDILQQFYDRWVSPRRSATIADLQRSKSTGELHIFGAIY